jgi:hypothetical protein
MENGKKHWYKLHNASIDLLEDIRVIRELKKKEIFLNCNDESEVCPDH